MPDTIQLEYHQLWRSFPFIPVNKIKRFRKI